MWPCHRTNYSQPKRTDSYIYLAQDFIMAVLFQTLAQKWPNGLCKLSKIYSVFQTFIPYLILPVDFRKPECSNRKAEGE